jgi:hypothetical protein
MPTTNPYPNLIGRVLSFNETEKTARIAYVFKKTPATKTEPKINSYSITDPAQPFFDWGSGVTLHEVINDFMAQCKHLGNLAFVESQILNRVLEDLSLADTKDWI